MTDDRPSPPPLHPSPRPPAHPSTEPAEQPCILRGGDFAERRRVTGVRLTGLFVLVLVLVLDQASKVWMIDLLAVQAPLERGQVLPLTGFLNLVTVWNRGVSFGLFASHADLLPLLLTGVAAAVSAVLAVWLFRTDRAGLAVALGLVIGGALGNAVDRLRWGAVFDFVDLHLAGWHWPAFNLADAAITVGVVLILLDGLFPRHDGRT